MMSIPAVLYDHIPVDDLEEYGYVSTVIHRASAPPEEGDCDMSRKSRNGSDVESDTIEDMDLDEHPMETIIEDINFDYVIIPIPPPSEENGSENTDLTVTSSPSTTDKILQTIKTYRKSLLNKVTRSSEWNSPWITKFWKEKHTVYLSKCVSKCTSGSRKLLRPLQCYARDWVASSAIYSSYDWVSETIVDASGNRLILPGSCVSLDERDRRSDSEGTLIVPAGTEDTSDSLPISSSSSSSSIWASKTIMVSAHDLLAIKYDQRIQPEDGEGPRPLSLFETIEEEEKGNPHQFRYYYRDQEHNEFPLAIPETTTRTIAQQWTRALWRLTERKAKIWYFISSSYLRRSLKNATSTFIHSQRYLIRYYQSRNRQAMWLLATLSNHPDGVGHDESRSDARDSHLSMVLDQKTSGEIIRGCDFGTRNPECTSFIEMPTHNSKRRKRQTTFY